MDMLGTVHKWKPNVTDMIWRCLGTAIAMPNTMETRAQEPWSDYSWFFTDRASKSNQQNIQKKNKQRLVTNEVRTRSERGTKRGQKTTRTDPYPNPGAGRFSASASSCSGIRSSKNEKNKYRSNPNGDKMIPWKYISLHSVYYPFMFESWPMLIDKEPRKKSTAWHTLIQEQRQHTWLTQNVWV